MPSIDKVEKDNPEALTPLPADEGLKVTLRHEEGREAHFRKPASANQPDTPLPPRTTDRPQKPAAKSNNQETRAEATADLRNGVSDDEPYIELVQAAGARMWEVRTHPELVTKLDRAPVLWLHDEAKTQQSFTPGMCYRLKNLRKYDKSIYWTVEGLVRDSGKPAYLIVSRSPQDEPESFCVQTQGRV